MLVVATNGFIGFNELALVLALVHIHLALSRYVAYGGDVERQLVVFVEEGRNLVFHINVHASTRYLNVLTDIVRIMALGVKLAHIVGQVEETGREEVGLVLLVDLAELVHLLVDFEQVAVLVVERHSHDVRIEQ